MSRSCVWKRDLEGLAIEFGCTVHDTRGDHYKIEHPSGWFVYTSRSPSDPKALRYVKSDLKRKAAGVWR